MSRGSSPTSRGPSSRSTQAASARLLPAEPTAALASPKPVMPASVSTRTRVESKARVTPKSLRCWRSSGIGTCSQSARTPVIFMPSPLRSPPHRFRRAARLRRVSQPRRTHSGRAGAAPPRARARQASPRPPPPPGRRNSPRRQARAAAARAPGPPHRRGAARRPAAAAAPDGRQAAPAPVQPRPEARANRFHPVRALAPRGGRAHHVLRAGRIQQPAHAHGKLHIVAHMGVALAGIAVEQALRRAPAQHGFQLPGKVGRIADAGAHALPHEGRGLVRGVAGDEQASPPPAPRDRGMEGVDDGALDLRVLRPDPGREQAPDRLGIVVLALLHPDFPAPAAARGAHIGRGPHGVAELAGIVAEVWARALQNQVDHQPALVETQGPRCRRGWRRARRSAPRRSRRHSAHPAPPGRRPHGRAGPGHGGTARRPARNTPSSVGWWKR